MGGVAKGGRTFCHEAVRQLVACVDQRSMVTRIEVFQR
jgi:hypothetical protein